MNADSKGELQWSVPDFWKNAEIMLRTNLECLGVESDEVDLIASDIMRRCVGIRPILPVNPESEVYADFGALICDMITAQQRLFAIQNGWTPGRLLANWPPTPVVFAHPFLIELHRAVNHLQAELNSVQRNKLN